MDQVCIPYMFEGVCVSQARCDLIAATCHSNISILAKAPNSFIPTIPAFL
jgi:hypothetical protein